MSVSVLVSVSVHACLRARVQSCVADMTTHITLQEFMIGATGAKTFKEAVRMTAEVHVRSMHLHLCPLRLVTMWMYLRLDRRVFARVFAVFARVFDQRVFTNVDERVVMLRSTSIPTSRFPQVARSLARARALSLSLST